MSENKVNTSYLSYLNETGEIVKISDKEEKEWKQLTNDELTPLEFDFEEENDIPKNERTGRNYR